MSDKIKSMANFLLSVRPQPEFLAAPEALFKEIKSNATIAADDYATTKTDFCGFKIVEFQLLPEHLFALAYSDRFDIIRISDGKKIMSARRYA